MNIDRYDLSIAYEGDGREYTEMRTSRFGEYVLYDDAMDEVNSWKDAYDELVSKLEDILKEV